MERTPFRATSRSTAAKLDWGQNEEASSACRVETHLLSIIEWVGSNPQLKRDCLIRGDGIFSASRSSILPSSIVSRGISVLRDSADSDSVSAAQLQEFRDFVKLGAMPVIVSASRSRGSRIPGKPITHRKRRAGRRLVQYSSRSESDSSYYLYVVFVGSIHTSPPVAVVGGARAPSKPGWESRSGRFHAGGRYTGRSYAGVRMACRSASRPGSRWSVAFSVEPIGRWIRTIADRHRDAGLAKSRRATRSAVTGWRWRRSTRSLRSAITPADRGVRHRSAARAANHRSRGDRAWRYSPEAARR